MLLQYASDPVLARFVQILVLVVILRNGLVRYLGTVLCGGAADALDVGIEQRFLLDKRFGDFFKKQFLLGKDTFRPVIAPLQLCLHRRLAAGIQAFGHTGRAVAFNIKQRKSHLSHIGGRFTDAVDRALDVSAAALCELPRILHLHGGFTGQRNDRFTGIRQHITIMDKAAAAIFSGGKQGSDPSTAGGYRPEVEPMFRSTPTSFFATLYNLNYNIPIEKVLIDPEKVAVDGENVLIASENPLIEAAIDSLNANKNTKENAKKLFAHMSFDGVFGRNDIMDIVNISITAAGNLINKLREAELLEPVIGQGKGKYKFAEPKKQA